MEISSWTTVFLVVLYSSRITIIWIIHNIHIVSVLMTHRTVLLSSLCFSFQFNWGTLVPSAGYSSWFLSTEDWHSPEGISTMTYYPTVANVVSECIKVFSFIRIETINIFYMDTYLVLSFIKLGGCVLPGGRHFSWLLDSLRCRRDLSRPTSGQRSWRALLLRSNDCSLAKFPIAEDQTIVALIIFNRYIYHSCPHKQR